MGIKGLLGSLKPYVEPVHVSKYAGQRVSPFSLQINRGTRICGPFEELQCVSSVTDTDHVVVLDLCHQTPSLPKLNAAFDHYDRLLSLCSNGESVD